MGIATGRGKMVRNEYRVLYNIMTIIWHKMHLQAPWQICIGCCWESLYRHGVGRPASLADWIMLRWVIDKVGMSGLAWVRERAHGTHK